MKRRCFDIPLKGSRSYIQGPDLFDVAFNTLAEVTAGAPEKFEISFHKMAQRQVELTWDARMSPETYFASGRWTRSGQTKNFWFQEVDADLRSRRCYPEDIIIDSMVVKDDSAKVNLSGSIEFSNMEIWVSMLKAMHQRKFSEKKGKWLFVKANLVGYEPELTCDSLRVDMHSALGTKLTRNLVYQNQRRVGEVYFALK